MSAVSLLNVAVKNNPAAFSDPYEFEITFEALEPLKEDLEWKLIYVGSATSSAYDQVLDSLLVGPVPLGVNKFAFVADAPDLKKIPDTEIIGVTVIILSGAYDDREFVRVGYYVNNEYTDEALSADPPAKPIIEKVRRNILAEKPRVTRFAIKWDSEETAPAEFPPDQGDVDAQEDDEAAYAADEPEEEEEEEEEVNGQEEEEDAAMGGTEEEAATNGEKPFVEVEAEVDEEGSEAGSEDIGEESEIEEEEEEEEEEGEGGEGGEEMDGVENGAKEESSGDKDKTLNDQKQGGQDVMVH